MSAPTPIVPESVRDLQARRDKHARICADLVNGGHLAEARRHAKQFEEARSELLRLMVGQS